MPELKITTHSKMKKFTDMDSSKLYGKKRKKNVWGCSPYHSKNRSLMDMVSIHFFAETKYERFGCLVSCQSKLSPYNVEAS